MRGEYHRLVEMCLGVRGRSNRFLVVRLAESSLEVCACIYSGYTKKRVRLEASHLDNRCPVP